MISIYDISMNISQEMPVYGNHAENQPVFKTLKDHSTGKTHESAIYMYLHTGTHIDAPLHMISNGGTTDNINLKQVITQCKVLDLTAISGRITNADLSGEDIKRDDFIIIKTRNSYFNQFRSDFVYLERSGAEFLRDKGVTGVGIDSLGIERDQPDHDTHKILFKAGIVILEGLRLSEVEAGEYFLLAAPLKIENVEAAPARAVLIKGLESAFFHQEKML